MSCTMITKIQAVVRRWPAFHRLLSDRRDGTCGMAGIEFAAIGATVLIMGIATADFGMGFYRRMQVQNAAQAGARYVMLYGPGNPAGIVTSIQAATGFADIVASEPNEFYGCATPLGLTVTYQNATCPDGTTAGRYVTVSAQATYNSILPLPRPFNNNYSLDAQFTVRVP